MLDKGTGTRSSDQRVKISDVRLSDETLRSFLDTSTETLRSFFTSFLFSSNSYPYSELFLRSKSKLVDAFFPSEYRKNLFAELSPINFTENLFSHLEVSHNIFLTDAEKELVNGAFRIADNIHHNDVKSTTRRTGEDYFNEHVLRLTERAVTFIAVHFHHLEGPAQIKVTGELIAACLLHDTIEDSLTVSMNDLRNHLEAQFGDLGLRTAGYVVLLTKENLKYYNDDQNLQERFHLTNIQESSVKALSVVKIFDRLMSLETDIKPFRSKCKYLIKTLRSFPSLFQTLREELFFQPVETVISYLEEIHPSNPIGLTPLKKALSSLSPALQTLSEQLHRVYPGICSEDYNKSIEALDSLEVIMRNYCEALLLNFSADEIKRAEAEIDKKLSLSQNPQFDPAITLSGTIPFDAYQKIRRLLNVYATAETSINSLHDNEPVKLISNIFCSSFLPYIQKQLGSKSTTLLGTAIKDPLSDKYSEIATQNTNPFYLLETFFEFGDKKAEAQFNEWYEAWGEVIINLTGLEKDIRTHSDDFLKARRDLSQPEFSSEGDRLERHVQAYFETLESCSGIQSFQYIRNALHSLKEAVLAPPTSIEEALLEVTRGIHGQQTHKSSIYEYTLNRALILVCNSILDNCATHQESSLQKCSENLKHLYDSASESFREINLDILKYYSHSGFGDEQITNLYELYCSMLEMSLPSEIEFSECSIFNLPDVLKQLLNTQSSSQTVLTIPESARKEAILSTSYPDFPLHRALYLGYLLHCDTNQAKTPILRVVQVDETTGKCTTESTRIPRTLLVSDNRYISFPLFPNDTLLAYNFNDKKPLDSPYSTVLASTFHLYPDPFVSFPYAPSEIIIREVCAPKHQILTDEVFAKQSPVYPGRHLFSRCTSAGLSQVIIVAENPGIYAKNLLTEEKHPDHYRYTINISEQQILRVDAFLNRESSEFENNNYYFRCSKQHAFNDDTMFRVMLQNDGNLETSIELCVMTPESYRKYRSSLPYIKLHQAKDFPGQNKEILAGKGHPDYKFVEQLMKFITGVSNEPPSETARFKVNYLTD
jgi:hypothetical protein